MTDLPPPPAHVEPYVRVLGIEMTVEFLMEFGGAELYLAKTPKARSRLAALIGIDKAKALAASAELLQRRVPTAKPWIASVMRAKGLPIAEIARTLHVSDVSVRNMLKKSGRPPTKVKKSGAPPAKDPRQYRLL